MIGRARRGDLLAIVGYELPRRGRGSPSTTGEQRDVRE